jgi:hypothetical protein
MADNVFLSQLIQSGPDAQSNLYRAKFTLVGDVLKSKQDTVDGEKGICLSVRLTKYNSPARSIQTVSLSYQNINIQIPVASSTLENKLSLTFRLDAGYKLYELLKTSLPINNLGGFNLTEESIANKYNKRTWNIVVNAYSGSEGEGSAMYKETPGEGVMSWTYLNCKLLNLPSLGYGYGSTSSLEVSCDFLYERCEEGPTKSAGIASPNLISQY